MSEWKPNGYFVDKNGKRIEVVDAAARASVAENAERVNQLTEEMAANAVPDYVITEANSVIDKIAAAQGSRTFTLAAITDLHYGNGNFTDGVKHAAQALKYIDARIKLDAVAVLGDFTDGFANRNWQYAEVVADFHAVDSVLNGLRFAPNLRIHGNHDFHESRMPEILRYTNAYSDDVVWESSAGAYFYRDFGNHKLRVICLNTVANGGGSVGYTDEQAQWFADTLDISDKADATDWHILILSHQPVDYEHASGYHYHMASIIDAYVKGTSYTSGDVSCDFDGKNAATLVGNIHGHIHNLLVDRIYVGAISSNVQTDALRIATPEACYGRPNGYSGVWHEKTTYDKTENTAEDTSFVVYCIDLDTNTIKAICYGAGYDRIITYGDNLSWAPDDTDNEENVAYTNQIMIATDAKGDVVTDGVMYADSRYSSSGIKAESGYFITGYIPVSVGDMIRVRWDATNADPAKMSICPHNANKEQFITPAGHYSFPNIINPDAELGAAFTGSEGFRVGYQGGFLNFTLPEAGERFPANTAYLTLTLCGDISQAIVTVNEEID